MQLKATIFLLSIVNTCYAGEDQEVLVDIPTIPKMVNIDLPVVAHLMNSDNSGRYIDLIREACARAAITVETRVFPIKRLNSRIGKKKSNCFFNTKSNVSEIDRDEVIRSLPLGNARAYIFTLKGDPVVSEFDESLTYGIIRGVDIPLSNFIPIHNAEVIFVETYRQNVELLKARRIDAVLGYLPDLNPFLGMLSYDLVSPIIDDVDEINCFINQETVSFIKIFNREIRAMMEDGTTKAIMGSFFLE
jgi:hypothetical protein